ncbi:MAG: sporulation protein [Oscillospiraceae bacterium]
MKKLKGAISALAALSGLIALLLCSAEALESAKYGLSLCARVIIPSLFPFFVVSSLIGGLGLPSYLGRAAAPAMMRLFGVSGEGAAAFVLGVTGGYPLGASVVADLVRSGRTTKEDGSRLLCFCNNSGPAFIVGAAGIGVFGSAGTGLLLYLSHVLAAITVGVLMAGERRAYAPATNSAHIEVLSFSEALPKAVRDSVTGVLGICGFVVFFTVCVGVLDASGVFPRAAGELAVFLGQSLHFTRALLTGLLELGSGLGALEGLVAAPLNLALCSFIIGWGGVSVHLQTAAVVAGTGIKTARHTVGRLLCGLISAIYTLALVTLL